MTGLMTTQDPAVLRRRLCRHLVQFRGERTQREVAEALDWSPSKLLRIENGAIGIASTDLRALLALYGVASPALVEMMVHMAKESRHSVAKARAKSASLFTSRSPSTSPMRRYHSSTSLGNAGIPFQSTTTARSPQNLSVSSSGGIRNSACFGERSRIHVSSSLRASRGRVSRLE